MFAQNLKYLRKRKGMEQIDLAYKLGRKSASSISEWEKGKYTPKLGVLSDIAKIFNVTISDLMEKDLSKMPDDSHSPKFSLIPVVSQVSAGVPLLAEESIKDYIHISETIITPGKEYFGLIIKGDSMDREFHDGDIIIVEKDAPIENGKIGVFMVDGELATVKRVKYLKDAVLLMPESTNEAHEPSVYHIGDNLNTIGKVVGMVRKY